MDKSFTKSRLDIAFNGLVLGRFTKCGVSPLIGSISFLFRIFLIVFVI